MNNQNNFMIVQGENLDENQLLGKFVYYSLADVLVDKDDFTRILPVHELPVCRAAHFGRGRIP